MLDIIKDLVRASCQLRRRDGVQPEPEDLARQLRLPLKDVRNHLKIAKGLVSLDSAVGDDGRAALTDGLSAYEELILCLRFEIDLGGDPALERIGEEFLETKRRLRRIEAKAVRRLREGKEAGPAEPD
ncbi:MAG: hypothetical protein HKM95_00545 [Inquilinus sp.]|nr:hypothetical protein [Inquilinus sp.]